MKIIFHPLFLLSIIFTILTGYGYVAILYMLALIIHEMSHWIIAKQKGYKLYKLCLQPFGVNLSYKEAGFAPEDEIQIALAGPLVNLIVCIVLVSLWWIFPVLYDYTFVFCLANFVIFIFNLLPCYPLDGGRILTAIISLKFNRLKAIKIIFVFNIIFSILFLILFLISIFNNINISFLFVSIFIFCGILDGIFESKYEKIILKKIIKKKWQKLNSNIVCFSSDTPIYKLNMSISKRKFNIFYIAFPSGKIKIITENILYNYYEKYDSHEKIGNIIN